MPDYESASYKVAEDWKILYGKALERKCSIDVAKTIFAEKTCIELDQFCIKMDKFMEEYLSSGLCVTEADLENGYALMDVRNLTIFS